MVESHGVYDFRTFRIHAGHSRENADVASYCDRKSLQIFRKRARTDRFDAAGLQPDSRFVGRPRRFHRWKLSHKAIQNSVPVESRPGCQVRLCYRVLGGLRPPLIRKPKSDRFSISTNQPEAFYVPFAAKANSLYYDTQSGAWAACCASFSMFMIGRG